MFFAIFSGLSLSVSTVISQLIGFSKGIEIASMADIPSGSGLGSSSTYTVGLLSALHNLKRDFIDSTRKLSPLMRSKDAIEIDSTDLTISEQVRKIIEIIK